MPIQPELFPRLDTIVNVASVPHRSLFRYPGGKTWFVPQARRWLRSLRDRPARFIEPFAGGGIVGLTVAFEHLADQVVLGELDAGVAAVWRCSLNGQNEALARKIETFHITIKNVRELLSSTADGALDLAFQTLVRNRVQHGGILAPGATLMRSGENGRGISSRWYAKTLAARVRAIATVASRIRFRRVDAFDMIAEHARDADAVFFVDPPYTVAGQRLYSHSQVDHEKLFRAMASVRGQFLMTYDYSKDVVAWAQRHGFEHRTVAMKSRQHTRKSELVIGRDLGWAS